MIKTLTNLCVLGGLVIAALPAQAIVSSTSDSLLSGSGVDYLDAMAKLTLTRTDGTFLCSGSLLAGGAYILTAAHCVSGSDGDASTSNISISLDSGAITATTTTYYVASGWDGDFYAGNDLALIELSTAITSIDGYTLYDASAWGDTVLIAGYGKSGTGDTGATVSAGTLYYGYNEYDADGRFYSLLGASSEDIYFYDFDSGTRQTSLFGSRGLDTDEEALVASGDSGGGSLIYLDGEWYLVGVHSFVGCLTASCGLDSSFGDYAGDVSIYGQLSWLQGYLVSAVPEPHAYVQLLAGLGMLAGTTRRWRGQFHR